MGCKRSWLDRVSLYRLSAYFAKLIKSQHVIVVFNFAHAADPASVPRSSSRFPWCQSRLIWMLSLITGRTRHKKPRNPPPPETGPAFAFYTGVSSHLLSWHRVHTHARCTRPTAARSRTNERPGTSTGSSSGKWPDWGFRAGRLVI